MLSPLLFETVELRLPLMANFLMACDDDDIQNRAFLQKEGEYLLSKILTSASSTLIVLYSQ
jgi:hypothetical protein